MKKFKIIANPIFLLMMIGSFAYLYFFYLADGPMRQREAAEAEGEFIRAVPPQGNPNGTTPVAGIDMQVRNRFPMQVQYPYGFAGQNMLPVAGGALGKTWIEAHWIGLEAGPITPAVAKANNIPPEVAGVLVDEVTLVSADAGLLAGDVITAINGTRLYDLKSFQNATRLVARANQAEVTIYRRGGYKKINISTPDELGLAQVEGAPMILATEKAPHVYQGPCDNCHAIAPGTANLNQMARDLGDVLPTTAPNIKKGTPPPHRPRGACPKCHVLL